MDNHSYLEQVMEDVFSTAVCETCSNNVSAQLRLVRLSQLHYRFFRCDVLFEVWVRLAPSIIFLRKRDLWIVLKFKSMIHKVNIYKLANEAKSVII